ncbi:MAG: guanine deaminase [Bryobacterales bacterium]|nr:guanine deaminase [Bryobacterales bacterium]
MASFPDGALAIAEGRVAACGDYADVRRGYPDAPVRDLRGGYLLPGFVDTHLHFPQVRVLGGLGYSLLEWLDALTLPEEARLADAAYACTIAKEFVRNLAAHGTTTSLVFGSHFPNAMAALFHAAESAGLRVISGLVLADRNLRPELHQTPGAAYEESQELIRRFHGRGRLGYAVTPRFALSTTEPMLEACQTLLQQQPGLHLTTHINENVREVEEVARLFPWAGDYLSVYERFELAGRRSVFAHNVQSTNSELQRLAGHGSSVAHCPCSNAALGSGIFPLRRHLEARVRFALGTDVGGGTGFGMMKEALQAYLMQRVAHDPVTLNPAQMLYLATRAGAEALALDSETGDFGAGKSADYVYLQPPSGSALEGVLKNVEDPERVLAAIITLAGAESIREVRVEGDLVYEAS